MMTDILERLKATGAERQRTTAHDNKDHYLHVVAKISNADGLLMLEAAEEIERLRMALRHYASANNWDEVPGENYRRLWLEPYTSTRDSYNGYDIARAALRGENDIQG
jgi:hypothetical protein